MTTTAVTIQIISVQVHTIDKHAYHCLLADSIIFLRMLLSNTFTEYNVLIDEYTT